MSETRHTAGPWHTAPEAGLHRAGVYAGDGDATVICDVTDEDMGRDEFKANARLIAAAPELLDVAELAHSLIVVVMRDHEGKLDRSSAGFMAEKLDAAVRKATGA